MEMHWLLVDPSFLADRRRWDDEDMLNSQIKSAYEQLVRR
jgi:hypothetical protein